MPQKSRYVRGEEVQPELSNQYYSGIIE
uniref:Uncharacterized protein n=1 Tax=Rhizophora mucronata TaxID=61149 RepID=A0A2P2PTB0_RHIMU